MWPCPPLYYSALLCAVVTANVQAPVIAAIWSQVPWIFTLTSTQSSADMLELRQHTYIQSHADICIVQDNALQDNRHKHAASVRYAASVTYAACVTDAASFLCVTRRIQMCDMNHSRVWHDTFTRRGTLFLVCHNTLACLSHYPFLCGIWLLFWRDIIIYVIIPFNNIYKCVEICSHHWRAAKSGARTPATAV